MFNKNFQRENECDYAEEAQGRVDSEAGGILLT